jgi:hypothetical protein
MVGVGVGTIEGDGVGDGVLDGVADADVEADVVLFAVVDAACDVLPAAWLLLVDDVQPAIDNEATISIIKISAIIRRFIFDSFPFMVAVAFYSTVSDEYTNPLFDRR